MPRIAREAFANTPLATDTTAGDMSAADKAKLDAATSADTASTLVMRDGGGNFAAGTITAALAGNASSATSATSATTAGACSGNAATATALQAGGADRAKLDGIAAGATANPMTDTGLHVLATDLGLAQNAWNYAITLTLGAGTWLVWGQAVCQAPSSGQCGFDAGVSQNVGAIYDPFGEATAAAANAVVTIPVGPMVLGAGTYNLAVYPNSSGAVLKYATVLLARYASYLRAIRIA